MMSNFEYQQLSMRICLLIDILFLQALELSHEAVFTATL